jgi:hypothetical protein
MDQVRNKMAKNYVKKVIQFEDLNPDYPNQQLKGLIKEIKKPRQFQSKGYINEKVRNIKSFYEGAFSNFGSRISHPELQKSFLKKSK